MQNGIRMILNENDKNNIWAILRFLAYGKLSEDLCDKYELDEMYDSFESYDQKHLRDAFMTMTYYQWKLVADGAHDLSKMLYSMTNNVVTLPFTVHVPNSDKSSKEHVITPSKDLIKSFRHTQHSIEQNLKA